MPLSGWITRLASSRAPSRPVAVARIGVAIGALLELPNSGTTLVRLSEPSVMHAPYLGFTPRPTEFLASALIVLWLLSAVAFLVGLRTRRSGGLLTVTLASVLFLDQQLYSNHLYLMTLAAGLLTVADCGAAVSLDARRAGARDWVAGWPVWVLCLQVSLVYGFAALAKLNPDFLSGSVVASYLRSGFLGVPDGWRSFQPMFVLSLLAVSTEAFLAFSLWSARWRPAAMVAGLGLHVFITGWLNPTGSLLVFSVVILSLYLLFLDAVPEGRAVVWDDGCGFCAGWVRWFRRLDWLHTLRFVARSELATSGLPVGEDAAARALQIVLPNGRVRGGFAAVSSVLEIVPLAFLWAPLLRLPPVAGLGERVYRRVAAGRLCELPVRADPATGSSSS
jgi:predicted DCC family thiol-disulfide oxidoreductase YuxK